MVLSITHMDNLVFEKHYKLSGFSSQRRYPNEALIRFLAEHYFSIPKGKRARIKCLEIGCGSGANLWMIAKEGLDTYGIDIAPTSIKLCKQMLTQYHVKAKVSVSTMQKLDFKDKSFDVIVDVMTVEHTNLQGHKQTYAEVFRCLKKGGRFFSWHLGSKSASFVDGGGERVDTLTVDNIPNTAVPYSNNGLTCFITPEVARKLLKSAGFIDIAIERVTRTYKNMKQEMEYFSISARKP